MILFITALKINKIIKKALKINKIIKKSLKINKKTARSAEKDGAKRRKSACLPVALREKKSKSKSRIALPESDLACHVLLLLATFIYF